MITVRVPAEIRKYKESFFMGFNLRQIASAVVTLLICVPLYFYGNKFLPEDVVSWLIMVIAVPVLGFGFFTFRGMPFEKFLLAMAEYLIFPIKRRYKTVDKYEVEVRKEKNSSLPQSEKERKALAKIEYQKGLEWAALVEEANEQGVDYEDEDNMNYVTVKSGTGGKGKKPKKRNERKEKKEKVDKLQEQALAIEDKIKNDLSYIPTAKENKIRKKYIAVQAQKRKKTVIEKKKQTAQKNNQMEQRRKAKSIIPKTTQQSIPYISDYEEGVFEVAPNKYSKIYRLYDINYRTASQEEQNRIFVRYCEFLNYFSDDLRFALYIDNRVISREEQERGVLYNLTGDSFDVHREEYNGIMRGQIEAGNNNIRKEKFISVTIDASSPIEALLQFHKVDAEVESNLKNIGCRGKALTTAERLSYYHDKFRKGKEGDLSVEKDSRFFEKIYSMGISSKDYIAPSSFEFGNRDFKIDDTWCRALFLSNLPSSLPDEFLFDICNNDFPVCFTLNVEPVANEVGTKIVRNQLTSIEKDKLEAEKRAIRSGYSPETIRHSIKEAHTTATQLFDDITYNNQKMFFVTMTCMVQADTKEELDNHCKIIESKARKYMAQFIPLTYQQEEGYKITLPFGYSPKSISVNRSLTTESLAIFMPFSNTEMYQRGGYYYGLNQISHNLVLVNRLEMKTPSGFVLGKSGSGKSFATKREILNVLLHDDKTNVLIIDPENEYGNFCRVFGGLVLKISADSDCYINPMEMAEDYGLDDDDTKDTPLAKKKEKALRKKSDYIMSIVERMLSTGTDDSTTMLSPVQRTIVDRCVTRCYEEYLNRDFDPDYLPTLIDLQAELDKEKKGDQAIEGQMVADSMAYFTYGNMDVFSHQSNVELNNRIVVFNVLNLGEQLKQIALIIVFDFIWNRMLKNNAKGIRTYCYCDEIHVMFQSYYSANFLKQLYKRGRKFGLCITGITQNVEDLLRSEQARGMIANSEFVMMLSQASEDAKILAELLSVSETQMKYIINADAGSGLLFAEGALVPFIDKFPETSYLYKLMSTKFDDKMTDDDVKIIIEEIMRKQKQSNEDANDDSDSGISLDLGKGLHGANFSTSATDTSGVDSDSLYLSEFSDNYNNNMG